MCPQSRREGHAHATAVADTSVLSWIVVVNLQCIEARSVANGNTSAKRIQKCPWESSLKMESSHKTTSEFP